MNIGSKKEAFDKAGYDRKYAKDNLVQIRLSLNKKHDADIIQRLHTVKNRTGYIKALIRKDLVQDPDDQ